MRGEPAELFSDPLFWQSLGKALGWSKFGMMHNPGGTIPLWRHEAHRYLDIVLIGGDTEKFWKDLLPKEPSHP